MIVEDSHTINAFASPEWSALWLTIQQALADFPEARIALAQALKESQT